MGNCANLKNKAVLTPQVKNLDLALITYTWTRDSHGLFDYENKSIVKRRLAISNNGFLFREDQEIRF